uniref:non-specific serine/threonine protein kinase n=1 Tax=Clastoptera arizonana TaxID=38151 RepID=A0A1B6CNV0_9HEMI
MITNNTNKLKASKGFKETEGVKLLDSEDKFNSSDKNDSDKDKVVINEYHNKHSPHILNVTKDKFDKSKPRSRNRDDFRIVRGSYADRRGNSCRGRGGSNRRSDRDCESGYISRGKFQESVTKGKSSDAVGNVSSSNKYSNESEGKAKTGEYNCVLGLNLPEDSRISKILRRMCREDDHDKFIGHCNQLQEALSSPDNSRYIRRAQDTICESLFEVFHGKQGYDNKLHAAKCLGRLGYVLDQEFMRFLELIFHNFSMERDNEVRKLIMKGLLETTKLDCEQLRLKEFAAVLMSKMHKALENLDNADLVMITVEVILNLIDMYPEQFTEYFRDTADILVGWHIDYFQPTLITSFAASALQRLSRYWIADITFTLTILGHFLEDTEAHAEELSSLSTDTCAQINEDHAQSCKEALPKVTSFIKVFNTVAKGLGQHLSPNLTPAVTWTFLNDCLSKVLATVLKSLECCMDQELVITGNESAWLLLSLLQNKTSPAQEKLYVLLDLEVSRSSDFTDLALSSMLQLISKVVKELSANLPLELVQRLLEPGSDFLQLRFSLSKTVHEGVIAVYHSLLSLKNIPLLKEAYRLILTDLESAYKVIIPEIESLCGGVPDDITTYNKHDVEYIILIHFKALADIANASNSLIGMWVLQPSILELLAEKLARPSVKHLAPPLVYALLYLLYSHCSKHNNFINSSNMLESIGRPAVHSLLGLPMSCEISTHSPTSGNLSLIINLLSDILIMEISEELKLLLLKWSYELINQASTYLTKLASTNEMRCLVKSLCKVGNSISTSVILGVCNNLEKLIMPPNATIWNNEILLDILEICELHLNSFDKDVIQRYSDLMLYLPSALVVSNLTNTTNRVNNPSSKLINSQHAHMTRGTNGEMQSHHFKQFMGYVLQGINQKSNLDWLCDAFSGSWSLCESKMEISLADLALSSTSVLLFWAVWESAQICVTCKLRTPLGKPLDTFMAFEGAVKSLAREAIHRSENATGYDIRRVRLLLEFIEQLEKSMYNAADGTAAALLAPPKPVRTFFHTNKSTCGEWLARNRQAVVVVSLHAGLATSAVRHGYCLLQDMLDSGNTKGVEFENTVIEVASALCKLKETEAIQGLYIWSWNIVGVKIPYLKALSDQAAGRLESAAESYEKLIANETIESNNIKAFLANQLTECYLSLHDWAQLVKWKNTESTFLDNVNGGSTQRYKHITSAVAQSMLDFEEAGTTSASKLASWNFGEEKEVWNYHQQFEKAQHTLRSITIQSAAEGKLLSGCEESIKKCQEIAHKYLIEGLRNTPSEILQGTIILQFAAHSLLGQADIISDSPLELIKKKKLKKSNNLSSSLLNEIFWWSQSIEKIYPTMPQTSSNFSLEVSRLARKENNLNLSLRQLTRHFNQLVLKDTDNKPTNHKALMNIIMPDIENCTDLWDLQKTAAYSEFSKYLYSVGEYNGALDLCAWSALRSGTNEDLLMKEKCSRILLTISKWLSNTETYSNTQTESLIQLLNWENNLSQNTSSQFLDVTNCDLCVGNVIPDNDTIIGRLLRLSVLHCPSLAKAWSHLASWCYRWGRRILDKTECVLTQTDKDEMQEFIPTDIDKEKVYSILSRTRPQTDEEDIEAENINTSEMIEWQLENIGIFNRNQITGLVEMWRKSHARVYSCYQLSAYAYFQYLQLFDGTQQDSSAITATLRLLRLIVKHALELQSVLEVGLSTTPTLPWICIIPQLFSRLSHPEPYVRRRVSELLCRLATDKPHLIIFPAVVGSDTGASTIKDMPQTKLFRTCVRESTSSDEDLDVVEEDEEDDEEDDDEDNGSNKESQAAVLENSFLAMVNTLSKQAPEAISQVQILVKELRRITLLWDELWLGTLVQHHTDISRRVSQLEMETLRVDNNTHLSQTEKDSLVAEKHRLILMPVLFVLEQLYAITSVTPETPHEQWFQDKFGASIVDALEKLRHPSNPRKPSEAQQALKALQCKLQARASKRASYALKMSDVSPAVATLKNTQIAMPGVKTLLTIAGVHDHIAVLPTKTKPKKLVFQGSDGQMYTYLFKGLEDLHLDERIMQFLCIANTMLRGSGYQARHYAVIPLGPRSGLISWVDHVTPLFALYKRWQQRQAAINQSTVLRPSELFYSKLTPLLKESGITNIESRKEWPLHVLMQVLTELMQETPTYLLSRELWCNSVNAGNWWQSTKLYSTSLAVMSIIGYIIGLGDRHLDNVLVDLTSGEVVHIDYNVCFEKGKTLRVPEKVPFRLTPNLRAALGVTGVEGMFRLSCEHVLKVMKKGRETVLTLLEAFVYDPLIDWTPGIETGYTGAVYGGGRAVALETKQSRKQLEREVTSAMFCVRIAEMRFDWLGNRDKLMTDLSLLSTYINGWLEEQALLKKAEDCLQERHQQMALVKEAEAHPQQHSLYSLPARYMSHRTALESTSKAKLALQERIEECDRQLNQYKVTILCFYGPQMSQWMSEVKSRPKSESYLVFDLIKEFLQNAGQSQMVSQCIQSEKELCDLCTQQTQITASCLDLLGQYSAIIRLFPASYINQHRATLYSHWSNLLLNLTDVQSCQTLTNEIKNALLPPDINSRITQQIRSYNLELQRLFSESHTTLSKCIDRAANINEEQNIQELERDLSHISERSPASVECVFVTALCSINKRFLMMENAAKSAMDCLVDLTSREGDWFLEDMCLIAGVVIKLFALLANYDSDLMLHSAHKCLQAAYTQYKGLQELNLNFTSIILPEAIQTVQKEDPTVLSLIEELNQVIDSIPCKLSDLINQLQLHLRFVIMGMESPHENCRKIVANLRKGFESLVQSPDSADSLSPGQMLFMGFNGLFENLALGLNTLTAALASLNTPTSWRTVDQLKEAKKISALVFDASSRYILEDIFLVKRLQTMQELFNLCKTNATGFHGGLNSPLLPPDDDLLNRPVRVFTADYVSSMLLGVFSQTLAMTICLLLQKIGLNVTGEVEQRDIGAQNKVSLEELCRICVDGAVKRRQTSTTNLNQASNAMSYLENAYRRNELNRRLKQEMQRAEMIVQRLQLQLTAHYWLHEDVLSLIPPPPIIRSAFMMELRKKFTALATLQPKLSEAIEQQRSLILSSEQRLKWAAGANPALSEVMCAFETSVCINNEQLLLEQRMATMVGNMCNSVIQHEALRTRTSEALTNDTAFLQIVENWETSCYLSINMNTTLTPVEESLVKLIPPDPVLDLIWINKAETLISESVKTLLQQMEPQKALMFAAQDNMKVVIANVRAILAAHHRIMGDIRSLLKSMAKFEDSGLAGLVEYLTRYRAYTERLSAFIKSLLSVEDLSVDRAVLALQEIVTLQEETPGIYEDLLHFSMDGNGKSSNKRPPLIRQNSLCVSPKLGDTQRLFCLINGGRLFDDFPLPSIEKWSKSS